MSVSRDAQMVAQAHADSDLITEFLTVRSPANAQLAFVALNGVLDSEVAVALANLRELIQDLPETPAHSGSELSILERSFGYESTGHSYRLQFDAGPGVTFGLEFVGSGNSLDLIVLYTVTGRHPLHGTPTQILTDGIVRMLLDQPAMFERLLEALDLLGFPIAPRFYLTPDDYVLENAAVAVEGLSDLF